MQEVLHCHQSRSELRWSPKQYQPVSLNRISGPVIETVQYKLSPILGTVELDVCAVVYQQTTNMVFASVQGKLPASVFLRRGNKTVW
jgi:hypothetical protein